MKRTGFVVCCLLTLCVTGNTVYAEELDYSDVYVDDYVEDVPVEDDPVEDVPVEDVSVEDVPVDDVPSDDVPVADVETESLSQEHLSVLDRLGELLEYQSSVSDNDIVEGEFLGGEGESLGGDDFIDESPFGDDVVGLLSSIDTSLSTLSDVSMYSDFTAFNGAISSTYLELFKGFLPKLTYKQHYILFRESQYVYTFVFGDDLQFNGNSFSGSDLTRIYFNAYSNGSFGHSYESTFSLSPGVAVVYTDLGTYYPSLSTDIGSNLIQIKWVVFIAILSTWMISLYKGFRRRGDRDKRWSSINTV